MGPTRGSGAVWSAQATLGVASHRRPPAFRSQEVDGSSPSSPTLSQTLCATQGRPGPSPGLVASTYPALIILCPTRGFLELWASPGHPSPEGCADRGGWAHRDPGCTESGPGLEGTLSQRAVQAPGIAGGWLLGRGGAGWRGSGSQGHATGSLGGDPARPSRTGKTQNQGKGAPSFCLPAPPLEIPLRGGPGPARRAPHPRLAHAPACGNPRPVLFPGRTWLGPSPGKTSQSRVCPLIQSPTGQSLPFS